MASVLNDYVINGRKSHDHAKRRIDLHLTPAFAGRRLTSVTTDQIAAFTADRLKAGASDAEVNRELAIIKRAYSLAMKAGRIHSRPYVAMLKEHNTRKGFLEPTQFAAVKGHLPVALQPLLEFGYLTGRRLASEVMPLEWRQVDWQGRVVRLDPNTTKSGEGRVYPFTMAIEALLKGQLAEHERLKKTGRIVALVFPRRNGKRIRNVRKAWDTACVKAGYPGRLLHDMRRSAVRNLERDGVPRSAAMAMVGHKTEAIYRRYAIVDAALLRDAAAKIDRAARTIAVTITPTSSDTPASQSA